ncbi:hypothetical protein GCM10023311_27920 [Flaviramulus aquimarinus]|uniref:40-residue YVTN family beta-propeller repeat-containing protein n=1 Tax=Flaviramulus aquimarinus TaxID=1170456 RepID=A0ABP9FFK0_9FLAO
MNFKRITVLLLTITFIFTSCSSDDDANIPVPKGDYENGILISHEGNFGQGNASVSFVSYDLDTVENNLFNTINGSLLGDTAQSVAFYNDLAYIVLNVSNTIEIVNRYTFESVATINSGLSNPRYIAFSNEKGYVTNWGDGGNAADDYVAIINLSTNTLEANSISVVEGPEEIIATGNTIYVAQQGGFSQNDKVSVIDTTTDTVTATITVGDVPNSLQFDTSGNLWVLCGGKPSWTGSETAGKLFKINTANNDTTSIDFATTEHPNFLSVENDNIYYLLGGAVYKMAASSTVLPNASEITGLNLYNMNVNNGILYGVDAGDFTSNGTVTSYDLSTNTLINTATVNIIPGGIYFN